jgi:hypothetical protein
MQIKCDFTIDCYLLLNHLQRQVVVDGKIPLVLSGLPLTEDYFGFRYQEFKNIPVTPVGGERAAASGRNPDTGKLQGWTWLAVEVVLVKNSQGLRYSNERQPQMDFSWPVYQRLVFPPTILGKVDIALIRPSSNLIYIIRFSCSGGTSDDQLEKFKANGQCDATDILEFLDRGKDFFQRVIHDPKWKVCRISIIERQRFFVAARWGFPSNLAGRDPTSNRQCHFELSGLPVEKQFIADFIRWFHPSLEFSVVFVALWLFSGTVYVIISLTQRICYSMHFQDAGKKTFSSGQGCNQSFLHCR